MKIGPFEVDNVYCMEVLEFLSMLPDSSVHVVFADYPFSYFKDSSNKRVTKKDELNEFVRSTAAEFYRVLKDGGMMVVFWQSIMSYYFTHHYSSLFKVMNVVAVKGIIRWSWAFLPYQYNLLYLLCKGSYRSRWNRIKGLTDFWDDCAGGKRYHREQISEKLVERVLTLVSKEGDVVLDPFVGGGNICVVAKRLNRHFIGCDIDCKSLRVAKARLEEAS